MEEARLWICESEAWERCPQIEKQRTEPRQGDPRKTTEVAGKEQHHEDKK